MARRPAALANCRPQIETPPVPSSSAVWPARARPATNSAFQAVTAAHGRVAACSSDSASGIATSECSEKTTSLASTPSLAAPGARAVLAGVGSPSIQSGRKAPMTRSPALKRVTPAPTASTSPAASEAGTTGLPATFR